MLEKTVSTFEKQVSGEPLYDQDLTRAPWSIDISDFSKIDSQQIIDRTINVIKNDHILLILTSEDGHRYGNTILIQFDEETLSIDKPLDFDEKSIIDFRIYFQDILSIWNFLETKVVSDCPYTLCATYPESIYRLQRRKYDRVPTPDGTRAIFWQDNQLHNAGMVKDISATGMLICTCKDKSQFMNDTNISEIAIALPRHPSSQRVDEYGNFMLPIIRKGTIVRSFRDKDTDFICHGVSFDDTLDIQKELNSFVSLQMQDTTGG